MCCLLIEMGGEDEKGKIEGGGYVLRKDLRMTPCLLSPLSPLLGYHQASLVSLLTCGHE